MNNCGHFMPDNEKTSFKAMSTTFDKLIYK